jgi:hypothetical protein
MDVATADKKLASKNAAAFQPVIDRAAGASQDATRRAHAGYSFLTLGTMTISESCLRLRKIM